MPGTASRYARLVLMLLIFWGAALHYMMLIPPFEGSDEREHLGYVTQLRAGAFPDPRISMENLAVQASAQAPLHYILVTLWSRLAPDYEWDGELPDNPWRSYVRPLPGSDNPNFTLFGPDQLPYEHNPNIGRSVIWQRFVSAFEGILTAALAYTAARAMLPAGWALFVMLIFSFNSVLVQIFALMTNDAAAILFGIFATYRLVVLSSRSITPRALLLTGIVVGFGTLTKLSVLAFVPVAGVIILLRRWKDWRAIIREGLLLALPVALIGGPWYLYQGIAFGDPLGIQPHLRMNWAHIPPRTLAQAISQDGLIPLFTLWSGYAWALLITGSWVFIFNTLLLGLGAIGCARAFRRLWQDYRFTIIALGLAWTGVFAAYLRWWTMFTFMNGRHLLPGYLALILLATLGLRYGWSARSGRVFRLAFATLTVFVAVVVVGNITLVEAFREITFPPEEAPRLEGTRLQFGDAVFMGYHIEPQPLSPAVPVNVTTCWQSLRQNARLPMPYAFSFHLVADDTIYAGRESYPGMGRYTNWQPNRAFCDEFTLTQHKPFEAGRGYRVAVTLFDPQTTAPLPDNNANGPFVGWAAVPGPVLDAPAQENAPFNFDGLYLLDYEMTVQNNLLNLLTQWGTGNWSPRPVTFFVHVFDSAGSLVGQFDTLLGEDTYPVWLWGQNERAYEQAYSIPLTAAVYPLTVRAGIYETQTQERLPVRDTQGSLLPDGLAGLGNLP